MALPVDRPYHEMIVPAKTASVGTTPVAAFATIPCKGLLVRTFAVLEGAITTAPAAIAVAINGTTVTGALSLAVGVAGSSASDTPTATEAARTVNEGDVISFTPSGATGASIPAAFQAVILRNK